MNLNKGCIEIQVEEYAKPILEEMNLNKGCIEIFEVVLLLERYLR